MAPITLRNGNELEEKLENEEDYKLAMLAYETLDKDNLKDFETLCSECGIDYEAL